MPRGRKRPPTPLRPNARRTRFTVEAGPPHGYEGGGSGRSHPENADPDQQVAKKDEAKYTLLVEWTNQQSSKRHSYGNFGLGVEFVPGNRSGTS